MTVVFIVRYGGITGAVRNSRNSIPERLLKIHGRWKSDSAKDMYVEERGKFLKKLWCCVGGKYNEIIWFYQLG